MGVNTTVDVTREDALKYIMSGLLDASDEDLCDVLYDIYGRKHLQNYHIVYNYENSERTINNPYGNQEEW